MKKFSDLKVGDKIYIFAPPDDIEPYTILRITTLSSGELIFRTIGDYTIGIRAENVGKSISISEDFSIYIDSIITDPKIAEWFDL